MHMYVNNWMMNVYILQCLQCSICIIPMFAKHYSNIWMLNVHFMSETFLWMHIGWTFPNTSTYVAESQIFMEWITQSNITQSAWVPLHGHLQETQPTSSVFSPVHCCVTSAPRGVVWGPASPLSVSGISSWKPAPAFSVPLPQLQHRATEIRLIRV